MTAIRFTLDKYEDLLRARTLPEWHFVSDTEIETDAQHAHLMGVDIAPDNIHDIPAAPHLFDYQHWVVDLAIEKRTFAAFLTTGLGKTAIQLEWARRVTAHHGGRTLIVAPLNVVTQTIGEAHRFYGETLTVVDARDKDVLARWLTDGSGIAITNYEKLDGTTRALSVNACVLDESSMLKSSMGSRRTSIMAAFKGVPWKLCCSATPAPNDRIEYAEHAYFLGIVRSTREFLARFFVNRDGEWQLKRHGLDAFYKHLASWSVFMIDPKAYRFADHLADMPSLTTEFPPILATPEQTTVARTYETGDQPSLFGVRAGGITNRSKLMQAGHGFIIDPPASFPSNKPQWIADVCNIRHGGEQVIVWVTFDREGDQLAVLVHDSVHISGKTPQKKRDELIDRFRAGEGPRVLILKPSMFGFGLNLQTCAVQVFSTITDSFERYYQAVRRSWRFGQTRPVTIYVPLTPFDEAMCTNVMSKQATFQEDATRQEAIYVAALRPADTTEKRTYHVEPQAEIGRIESEHGAWTMVHGDSIAHMPTMPEDSVDLAVFSPPFANLFTYSSGLADMGNVRSDQEYRLQWKWFAERLLRVMKPGRVVAVHCMDVIRFAGAHGHRFTYDYPSDLRAGMEDAGFHYHARIAIDKNPQIQATRTKDHNLLFVTLTRNALNSHPQASECVLIFRKPGESEVPVIASDVSNQEWITWAHHVWYGIRETDVLNAALAKEAEDERHICPLQLSLIERCVRLWSNKGETVFSPFAGIGSEGWEALGWERRFYGVELKESYYRTACRFLTEREQNVSGRLDFA